MVRTRKDVVRLKFLIVGGDLRFAYLAVLLRREGHEVCCFALDEAPAALTESCALAPGAMDGADCVVLPLPVLGAGGRLNAPLSAFSYDIEPIFAALPKTALVCGGLPNERVLHAAREQELELVDYFKREELVALNALATAEGAIDELLRASPLTIWDSRVLIAGYGRIGKLLATRLRALGAHVTVSARSDGDKAYIRANGFAALDTRTLSTELGGFDTVVNTVPARIFTAERLAQIRSDAVCLDLASRPGGFDLEAAKALDRNVIWALGLPAETAPETAGRIIGETVLNILREKRA